MKSRKNDFRISKEVVNLVLKKAHKRTSAKAREGMHINLRLGGRHNMSWFESRA